MSCSYKVNGEYSCSNMIEQFQDTMVVSAPVIKCNCAPNYKISSNSCISKNSQESIATLPRINVLAETKLANTRTLGTNQNCPPGFTRNGSMCYNCDPGFTREGIMCYKCNSGYTRSGALCVPNLKCDSNNDEINNLCYKKCQTGYIRDPNIPTACNKINEPNNNYKLI
jgi:hypothetical protein